MAGQINKNDKIVLSLFISIIVIIFLLAVFAGCSRNNSVEFKLDLANIVETGYGNTIDGDSMYWAIYEDWNKDSKRCLLYMDKQTFDSLETVVAKFNNYPVEYRDSVNNIHGFTLIEDSKGLHISSIK